MRFPHKHNVLVYSKQKKNPEKRSNLVWYCRASPGPCFALSKAAGDAGPAAQGYTSSSEAPRYSCLLYGQEESPTGDPQRWKEEITGTGTWPPHTGWCLDRERTSSVHDFQYDLFSSLMESELKSHVISLTCLLEVSGIPRRIHKPFENEKQLCLNSHPFTQKN